MTIDTDNLSALTPAERQELSERCLGAYVGTDGSLSYAVAANGLFGWPIVCLRLKGDPNGRIYHAGVRRPDGKIFDMRGLLVDTMFKGAYRNPSSLEIQEITPEDIWDTRRVYRDHVEYATKIINYFYSDLPRRSA